MANRIYASVTRIERCPNLGADFILRIKRTSDARTIAVMNLKSYTDALYHNEELKSLTRYGFDKV